jgi:hypothetical protein
MSGLIFISILAVVSVALTGIICLRSGRERGLREGLKIGYGGGWRDAHRRIGTALNVAPEALDCALLHLEIDGRIDARLQPILHATSAGKQPAETATAQP